MTIFLILLAIWLWFVATQTPTHPFTVVVLGLPMMAVLLLRRQLERLIDLCDWLFEQYSKVRV